MMNPFHKEILTAIKQHSGKPTSHTFLDAYLGNSHPRYPINAPKLHAIAKSWTRAHKDMTAADFAQVLTSLVGGVSSTEKVMAGILMDYATREQREFDPRLFEGWLEEVEGWAEVDALCTGNYTITQIPKHWKKWNPLLSRFSRDKNIHKRRASLVFFCSPVRHVSEHDVAQSALKNIERLKSERHVLITKAISWLLRSMVRNYRDLVSAYVNEHAESLPAIAVRETLTVLKTGKKTKSRT